MIFCSRCGTYAEGAVAACPKCGAALAAVGHDSLKAGFTAGQATSMEPAGHVQRVIALIIDNFLKALILCIGVAVLFFVGDVPGILMFAVTVIVAIAYEPYFIAANGATPGKSTMGLRVVNQDGGPVGAGQSIARWLLKDILNGLFIPIFVPLFTERRQGLHDIIVSTFVVRA